MKFKSILLTVSCALLVAMVGCNKEDSAELARKERAAALRAEARTAESQGNLIAAETFYRQLLTVDPTDASAHLSLANLSHDARKNYMDAIYHYQRYLDLMPESDKKQLVTDRLASAKTLLANQFAAEIVAREHRTLTNERDSLQAKITDLQNEIRKLNRTVSDRDEEIEKLKGEVKRLSRLVEQLKTIEAETRASHTAMVEKARQELEAERSKPTKSTKQSALDGSETDDLVKAARAEADAILGNPDGALPPRDDALRAKAEGATDEIPITAAPTPGKRYLVRPGDRYSALAREAYGSAAQWPRIRDANRSTTNPDGRLLAGETILIP